VLFRNSLGDNGENLSKALSSVDARAGIRTWCFLLLHHAASLPAQRQVYRMDRERMNQICN
jgi:hypothetical protein